ncbi:MAG: TylF/MycF family methyltransferase [Actinomycetota bacterium]|nr:TylF/MycF family methyltransferase [Actinomycetota bacterium]
MAYLRHLRRRPLRRTSADPAFTPDPVSTPDPAPPPDQPAPAALAGDLAFSHASDADQAILRRALPHTMTGTQRLLATVDAVRYCAARAVGGALVECGVWRGGSVLAMILTLQELDIEDRDIYLFDTFEGMTEPTESDVSRSEGSALAIWRAARQRSVRPWEELFGERVFDEGSVRELLHGTSYPQDRLHFVRGPVERTLPAAAPPEIALLRLDTDWYESTRHELGCLYPRLRTGGVLIIDDYGHWQGARTAVDEYFAGAAAPLLSRIDYTGRIAVKA